MDKVAHSSKGPFAVSVGYDGMRNEALYDDVFSRSRGFGEVSDSFALRREDYADIFGGFSASSSWVSSIPVLELPSTTCLGVHPGAPSTALEYADIFRGFEGHDVAVSFDELVKMTARYSGVRDEPSASESNDDDVDAWISSESEYVSEESDSKNHLLSNGNSFECHYEETEFSKAYCNVAQSGNSLNGLLPSKNIDVNPEYSFSIDRSYPVLTRDDDYLPYSVSNGYLNAEFSEKHVRSFGKKKKETINGDVNVFPVANELTLSKDSVMNGPSGMESFVTVSDVSLKTQPSSLPPPGRPAPALSVGNTTNGSVPLEVKDKSQAHCEFEIDGSSKAASAAIKEVMKQAEAKLKSAKELMERKKGSVLTQKLRENKMRDERLWGTVNGEQSSIDLPKIKENEKVKQIPQICQDSGHSENCPTMAPGKHEVHDQKEIVEDVDKTLGIPSREIFSKPLKEPEEEDQSSRRSEQSNVRINVSCRKVDNNVTLESTNFVPPRQGNLNINKYVVRGNKDVILESDQKPVISDIPEVTQNIEWVEIKFQAPHDNHFIRSKQAGNSFDKASLKQNTKVRLVHDQNDMEKNQVDPLVLEEKVKSMAKKYDEDKNNMEQEESVVIQEHRNRLNRETGSVQNSAMEMEANCNADDVLRQIEGSGMKENEDNNDKSIDGKSLPHCREEMKEVPKSCTDENGEECRPLDVLGKDKLGGLNSAKVHEINVGRGESKSMDRGIVGNAGKERMNGRDQMKVEVCLVGEIEKKLTNNTVKQIAKKLEENITKKNIEREDYLCKERATVEGKRKVETLQACNGKKDDDRYMGRFDGRTKDDIVIEMVEKNVNDASETKEYFTVSRGVEDGSNGFGEQETFVSLEKILARQGSAHNTNIITGSAKVMKDSQSQHSLNGIVEEAQLSSKHCTGNDTITSIVTSEDVGKSKENKIVDLKKVDDLRKPTGSGSKMNCNVETNCGTIIKEDELQYQEIPPEKLNKSSISRDLNEQMKDEKNKIFSNNLEVQNQGKKDVHEKWETGSCVEQRQSFFSQNGWKPDSVLAGGKKENDSAEVLSDLSKANARQSVQKRNRTAFPEQASERQVKLPAGPVPFDQEGVRMKTPDDRDVDRLKKLEEEWEREREREKDRMAVDRSSFEARVTKESRERAERAIVEKIMNEARERLERACNDARELSLKNRGNVENNMRVNHNDVDKSDSMESSLSNSGVRLNPSSLKGSAKVERSGVESESPQRCKARLERHRRIAERAAQALAEKNKRDLLAQKENADRNRLADALDADVKRWSNGKEGNLRALLSTLHYILGPDSGWQAVPLTEVITDAAVKKAYRKATLRVHPDKLQQRGASIQQKYVCEKVFDLLKDAWSRFNSEER